MPLAVGHVAEAVLADMAAGVNYHAVSDMGVGDRAAGADGAIGPDLNPLADHGVRRDQRAGADLDRGPDHHERIDRHVRSDLRRRMHDRARRGALRAERQRPDAARCRTYAARP